MGHEIGMGMLLTLPFVCCFLVMLAYCLWCIAYGVLLRRVFTYCFCDVFGYAGPLSQAVVEEIFNALAVVHQCGILHGDIRPNNILVTNGGQPGVRFLDFGFACFVTSDVDRKRECAQLESLMSEFTCLDVTSQFQLEQRQEV